MKKNYGEFYLFHYIANFMKLHVDEKHRDAQDTKLDRYLMNLLAMIP